MSWAALLGAASLICAAALPVDSIVSRYRKAPAHVPSTGVPDGPLVGNGQTGAAINFSQPGSQLEHLDVAFHIGHNAFFAAPTSNISSCGYTDLTRGGRKALGGLRLTLPNATSTWRVPELFPANGTFVLSTGHGFQLNAFMHAVEDVLMVNLSSSVPCTVQLTLWTYNGCSGVSKSTSSGKHRVHLADPSAGGREVLAGGKSYWLGISTSRTGLSGKWLEEKLLGCWSPKDLFFLACVRVGSIIPCRL